MPTWLVLNEAARQFNIPLPFLETLISVGSLTLRRAVRSRLADGAREVATEDLEQIMAEPHRSQSGTFTAFGDGFENSKGEWLRTIQWVKDKLKILFSPQSLIRFHREKTPLLGNTEFEGYQVPVYVGSGNWKQIWVFKQTQLEALKEILAAGYAIDPLREPVVTYQECKDEFGLGRTILNDWHANGIPEFGDQKLSKWYEWRLKKRKRSGRPSILVAKLCAVFSRNQIKDTLEARRKKAIAAQGAKTELTDREAMARFEGIFREGDLYRWRNECEFIGRKLRARQLPDGTWLNNLEDLEGIAQKLIEYEEKCEIIRNGKSYIPLRAFLKLTGYKNEQDVGKYCQGKNPRSHSALGRPIERIPVDASEKYIRRNKHPENHWYLKEDGEKIRDWRAAQKAARERPIQFLLALLAQGPVLFNKICELGDAAGFPPDVLQRARKMHNRREDNKDEQKRILPQKIDFSGPTVWYLEGQDPEQFVKDPKMPQGFARPCVHTPLAPSVEVSNPLSRPIPVRVVVDADDSSTPPGEPISATTVQPTRKAKRSTEAGEARIKIIAELTRHHQYADGGCLNLQPIGNNELARRAEVSQSTAKVFFDKEFGDENGERGHAKYRGICRNPGQLVASLKILNNEYSPHNLYGRRPPGEDDRGEVE